LGHVRSSFALDTAGEWLVQVLATTATGPRPVVEAAMFADVAPPAAFTPVAAPGESAAAGAPDDATALARMLAAARTSEGRAALARDPELDRLAAEHAAEMMRAGFIGHDVGGGDPRSRLEDAGVSVPRVAGENVAVSKSLAGAHRALWASPSHRGNLLETGFGRFGVGVARGTDGAVWVVELFVG
jgi:uncharacterized protein YkwD